MVSELVDATGTRRRLRALAWQGWTFGQIERATGRNRANLLRTAVSAERVRRDTAEVVARTYAELVKRDPGSTEYTRRASRYALRRGWLGPGAWDNLDNPDAEPDPSAME